jgi:cob(I)alamin adenosyltransferase
MIRLYNCFYQETSVRYKELAEKITKRDLTQETCGDGLTMVFTGEGKGKTTAALGTVIRALGQGFKVYICFFMKGEYPYGERNTLSKLPGVTIASFGQETFVFPKNVKEEQIAQAGEALKASREALMSGKYDLVVLDEINVAAAFKLIAVDDVLQLIKDKPKKVELILTGRLVTEMVKIKHPFDKGIQARKGIEY